MLHDIDRLDNHMATVFNGDPGLSYVPPWEGLPVISEQAKEIQKAWIHALVSTHGHGRVHAAYLAYRQRRRQEEAANMPTLTSWDGFKYSPPSIRTPRLGESLCTACRTGYAVLLVNGAQEVCAGCARQTVSPHQASPLWTPYTDPMLIRIGSGASGFVPALITPDGEDRPDLLLREASCFAFSSQYRGFPSSVFEESCASTEKAWDTYVLRLRAQLVSDWSRVTVEASFTYDGSSSPTGDQFSPYGFRLATATLYAKNSASTHTEIYDLLGAVLDALHPAT